MHTFLDRKYRTVRRLQCSLISLIDLFVFFFFFTIDFYLFIYLFFYFFFFFYLWWILSYIEFDCAARGLSLLRGPVSSLSVALGGPQPGAFSPCRALGLGRCSSRTPEHRLDCGARLSGATAPGSSRNRDLTLPCLLYWQLDSLLLSHQESLRFYYTVKKV